MKEFETDGSNEAPGKYNMHEIKEAAEDRWPEVISKVANIDVDVLDGAHHPCPKCGGDDRFNLARDRTGGCYCNECQPGTGDGIQTIKWLSGKPFNEVIIEVAEFLGIKKSAQGKRNTIRFIKDRDEWFNEWCSNRMPIKVASLKAVGAKCAKLWAGDNVIAIPVLGETLDIDKPVNWVISRVDGEKIQLGKELVSRMTMPKGKAGIIGMLKLWEQDGATWWKTEGPTDLLSLLSMPGFPAEGHAVFTTAFGAKEKPPKWILKMMKDQFVNVVHDADKPGQEGALWIGGKRRRRPGWCPQLADVAAQVKNVTLPFPVEETNGKDLRDFAMGGGKFEELTSLANQSLIVGKMKTSSVEEDDADPDRLATVILGRYADEHGGILKFYNGTWRRWKRGQYRTLTFEEMLSKNWITVRDELEHCWRDRGSSSEDPVSHVSMTLVRNVMAAMQSKCLVSSSVDMPCWLPDRSHPNYVSCGNGIINMDAIAAGHPREAWLIDHSPQWFSDTQIGYDFDPDASCPTFDGYLEKCLESDGDRIAILQEFAGYCLMNGNPFQRFLVLEGEGANGKGAFFTVMRAMLGDVNVSGVQLHEFANEFNLGSTLGKVLNIAADVDTIDRVAEGPLKSFTGGDAMCFNRKFKNPIVTVPTAKLMMGWNQRPKIRDRSQGIWRRMIIVPFDYVIPEKERVGGMTMVEWWIETGEMPGVLNWSIAGMRRLIKQGGFSASKASEEAVEEYRIDSNPAKEFLLEHLGECTHGSVVCTEVYRWYREWCLQLHRGDLGCSEFGKEVHRVFPHIRKSRPRAEGKRDRHYVGIAWTTDNVLGKPIDRDLW